MKDRIQFYQTKVSEILKKAKQKGATEAEVALSAGTGISTSVRNQEVETIENQNDQGMAITVYFGKQKGSADTGDLAEQSLMDTLDAACSIAEFTLADPYAGLPDIELLAKDRRDLSLDHPYTGDVESAIKLALDCEKIGLDFDKRISNSEGANFSTYRSLNVYGNSLGFLSDSIATHHSLSLSLIANSDNNGKERDYSFSNARDFADLWNSESIAQDAAARVLRRLNPRKIKTQKVPVIFAAHLASGLIRNYLQAVSGGSLYRKTSFLLNSLDTQVFPKFVSLYEDPFVLKGLGSAPFDGEGVAIQPKYLVEQGKVSTYLLSTYTARHLGMQTTGHSGGVRNVFVQSDVAPSFEEMLAEMGTGLLVTELIGQGVNPVTGDYSRGASGLWVENGKIQFPVSEITIAGNLKEMFKSITAIATDTEKRDKIQTGSILINEMMVAGE